MDDYYLALVGELFERMRDASEDAAGWARLGNAFVHFADTGQDNLRQSLGIPKSEATLFAAAAFYCGGFPASAYLTLRGSAPEQSDTEIYRACFDLLARPKNLSSQIGQILVKALLHGDMATIYQIDKNAITRSEEALQKGPDEWIPARLFEQLFTRFLNSNVRAVLPLGDSDIWTPFIESLLSRQPPSWEFFPSQIDAIKQGLLVRNETFSLQMPTGAGKTALCETLLYWHAKIRTHDVAILLVPYRSLASELRYSVVKRLNKLGISARCAYGGTVPTKDEVQILEDARVLVSTPEALSGLLGASGSLYSRVSLVICDEGHLLDSEGRGVGLELLLARLRAREGGAPRFVFVSAIVPNIEEINAWLGGASDSVVRSNYRPSIAEYAVLRPVDEGKNKTVSLDMHPHEPSPTRYQVQNFLSRADFKFRNSKTGRSNTYDFTSMKTQAIAAGRKALAMGAVAVFAANKRGNQGAIGLADELVKQLQCELSLPEPIKHVSKEKLAPVIKYLELEYGSDWLGTRIVAAGAVLHHGDIPQEAREVLENLLRCGDIQLVICTNTLAEGVNLPIRTLILYSVQRRQKNGQQKNLLARDIKNLVGRAGRAGATTKGMVICANQQQWWQIEQVARQTSVETVHGALWSLVEWLSQNLAKNHVQLTNVYIEALPALHKLVDGIDSTLIDLAAEEIGEDALVAKAIHLADETFASQQLNEASKQILQKIFELRARRVLNIHEAGRINWIRETGARLRMLESVETDLFRRRSTWDDIANPLDPSVIRIMLEWAWGQADVQEAVREAYRYEENADTLELKQQFFDTVDAWLRGCRPVEIAGISKLSVDDLLTVHGKVVSYVMQSTIEQGVALLAKVCEDHGNALAPAVIMFPEHLRFGVPTTVGRVLAAGGVRHRSAAVELGNAMEGVGIASEDRSAVFGAAQTLIYNNPDSWKALLGILVFQNTIKDLSGNESGVAEY
ncbi:DEAD/DEAH box helicase [Azospirillum sp. YIM B02556]|uniref:DEAD/DEAH box helicase n=1 Tax=Azospirillum endophyticum TaxID=2800326 RepID=A0ABS1FE09_9PROT|nr:DEAD/DEAH box helicase [Azospirillum endophyticum]MBK1841660.1 DEAD/DEAH box helicase [Azospirillum endophyticum]